MKTFALFLAFLAFASAAPAPLYGTESSTAIANEYIVIFKNGVNTKTRDNHVNRVRGVAGGVSIPESQRFFIGENFAGYWATLVNGTLEYVRNQPEVKYVEANMVVTIAQQSCTTQTKSPSWGLDRIDEVQIQLDGVYTYPTTAGKGTTSYIIDTGVYIQHSDFGGRAVWGANFADSQNADCNGHGTHVAGTVGGTTFGVAKQTTIVAVKVLNCGGSGTIAGVIAGVEWVAKDNKGKSTANMSLGGGFSKASNDAVAAAVASGVTFVCAAGNSNTDACTFSPASEPTAISVGSTAVVDSGEAQIDARSTFSNFGNCTQIYAPGSLITSAWIGAVDAERTISGTSMAAPHVAGVAALIYEANPKFTPAQVKAAIVNSATSGVIAFNCPTTSNSCKASPNKLLYHPCP